MKDVVNENINYREDRTFYIYIHTCPNMKVYVGQSTHPKQRWNKGKGYKDNKGFYEAIQCFGWDNIKHEIIAETHYAWMARKIEKHIISLYKKQGKCYNKINEDKPSYISKRTIPLRKVGKYSKEGKFIREYNSASEAWKDGNPPPDSIQACCRGTIKTSGGYIWKYL